MNKPVRHLTLLSAVPLLLAAVPLLLAAVFTACQSDDTDFSEYTNGTATTVQTIYIDYNGSTVTVSGDTGGFVSTVGADVTVDTGESSDSLLLVLSGTTTDGSLLVFRERKYGIRLNGVDISNADGPAINNQCGKSLYLDVADGTTNTLTDGTTYAAQSFDQKGALFSEGQIYIIGTGTLNVYGNCRHAVASDDYIVVCGDATLNIASTAGNGLKVNDGLWVHAGTIGISVTADGARGIRSDSVVVVTGGDITVSTSGGCVYDAADNDYSSAACVKCDYDFTMTGGTLAMSSTGDGGKGINSGGAVTVSGGVLSAVTKGSNNDAKPKAVKGSSITVSGGTFLAKVNKSWACDNGYEDAALSDAELAAKRVTVVGTPVASTVTVDGKTYTSPTVTKRVTYVAF